MQLAHGTFLELWQTAAPGALDSTPEDIPAIQTILPAQEKATGAAIIVVPGGGYRHRAAHEAVPVAEWLAGQGITAFVLRYRLGPKYTYPTQLHDAQRALRFVRAHASAWQLDPARIGILGFSAGGHIVSMTATRFTVGQKDADDAIERVSSRPDIQILIYPVISLEVTYSPIASLLGGAPDPSPAQIAELSSERHVTSQTPPAFLVHSTGDVGVRVENSDRYAERLAANGVPYEFVRGALGNHGFGLINAWTVPCEQWLRTIGFAG